MQQFLLGLVVGIAVGCSVAALAADVFGTGYLSGWTVTKTGVEVCADPLVIADTKAIECN